MYNRYLNSQSRSPRPEAEKPEAQEGREGQQHPRSSPPGVASGVRHSHSGPRPALPGSLGEGLRQLKGLLGEGAELGDLLLILILLLLYLEKEDEEILIVLSALVVMGFR